MNNTFQFRQATPEEADSILALYRSVIGSEFCAWDETYPGMDWIRRDLEGNGLYVLTDGTRLLGTLSVVPEKELDAFPCWQCRDGTQRELARVAVSGAARGLGLGAKMVREISGILAAQGCHALHLAVAKGHLPAFKTYRKAGFAVVGEAELYGGQYDLMEVMLTDFI